VGAVDRLRLRPGPAEETQDVAPGGPVPEVGPAQAGPVCGREASQERPVAPVRLQERSLVDDKNAHVVFEDTNGEWSFKAPKLHGFKVSLCGSLKLRGSEAL
jgi:hypothetical protein